MSSQTIHHRRAGPRPWRLLFDCHPQPMWIHDPGAARILAVNQAALEHYGYTREEFLALRPADLRVEATEHDLTWNGRAARLVMAGDASRLNQRLRALVEASPLPIAVLDVDGRVELWNPAAEQTLGWTAAEVLGNPLPALSERSRQENEANIRQILAGHPMAGVEMERSRRDGSRASLRVSTAPLRDARGRVDGLVILMEDITVARATEQALRETEARYQDLFENVPIGIYRTSPDGRLLIGNPALLRICGFSCLEEARANALHPGAAGMPGDRERFHQRLDREGEVRGFQSTLVRQDGTEICVQENARAVRAADGTALYYEGTLEDVSAQKAAERALERGEQYFRSLLENALDIITILDARGIIRFESPSVERVLGYPLGHNQGRKVLEYVHPDDQAKVAAIFEIGLPPNSATKAMHLRFRHHDGSWRVLESVAQDRLADPAVAGIVVNSRDVTERKLANDKLKQNARDLQSKNQALEAALAAAREAAELKSRFLANMSHEIRTPMNGVVGMAELLLATPLNAEQQEYVEAVKCSAEALLTVINDILDISKIEAGKLDLETVPFAPAAVVREVADLLRLKARQRGLALECRIAPDVPARVLGDPARLRQVLMNLAGNGVKFTEKGAVELWAEAAGEGLLRFTVRDTGIGIRPEQRAQIFGVFAQGDASVTRRYGGTGLGLAIARQLVELMGGGIDFTSEPGRGSAFWFTAALPAAPDSETAHPVETENGERRATGRILLAEDHAINQRIAVRILQQAGYTVAVAQNGREAVEAVLRERFDAIFMDIQMPEMDGLSATLEIRRREPEGTRTPIIAMTASAMSGDRERCLAAGMDDYVSKPVRSEEIRRAARRWIP